MLLDSRPEQHLLDPMMEYGLMLFGILEFEQNTKRNCTE